MAENLNHKLLSLLLGSDDSVEIEELKRSLAKALARSINPPPDPVVPPPSPEEQIADLKRLLASYSNKHTFKPGDVVKWKPGLKNRTYPSEHFPGIVMEVLDTPLIETTAESGSTYFNERLDIRVGVIGPGGELVPFYFDSSHFEPY